MFKKRKGFLIWFDLFPIIIIVLNILDFFEIISTSFDFSKKILSWIILAILLLKESPSKVFFGHRHKIVDRFLLLSYFLMILKNITSYANVVVSKKSIFQQGFIFLLEHHKIIEETSFFIGIILLFLVAIWATLRIKFDKRSVMGVLHEEGKPDTNIKNNILRFFFSFLVFISFFLFVFNLMMEWLAIAIDSVILMIALLFYSVLSVQQYLGLHKFLSRVGKVGSSFYKKFIDHFRYKESLLLGISGILVLHALTDIGNFLIPYITGIKDQLYFGLLGKGHDTIWTIINMDLSSQSLGFGIVILLIIFLANVFGYFFLFASPAIIWYLLAHKKVPRLPKRVLVIFFTCLIPSLLSPLFKIKTLSGQNLIGVDVQTQSIFSFLNPNISFVIMVLALIIAVIFVEHRKTTLILERIWLITTLGLFGIYTGFYFWDVSLYYQDVINGMIAIGNLEFATIFIIFETLTVAFYVGGFVLFCWEVWKKVHKRI